MLSPGNAHLIYQRTSGLSTLFLRFLRIFFWKKQYNNIYPPPMEKSTISAPLSFLPPKVTQQNHQKREGKTQGKVPPDQPRPRKLVEGKPVPEEE